MTSIEKRLEDLEDAVKPPSDKKPYDFYYRDPAGNPYKFDPNTGARVDLTEEEVDAMRAATEVLFAVEYTRGMGKGSVAFE